MTDEIAAIALHTAARYRAFATTEAAGSSPTFVRWAGTLADDEDLLALLAGLPRDKRQPNLVFAAARLHGALPGDADSLREVLTSRWTAVEATIRTHATQTNEAARCAAILLGLRQIPGPGPIALLELGSAAGLCLIPDRYSYAVDGTALLHPCTGPSPVTVDVHLGEGLELPATMPDIAWRAGLDLNPLDPADPDTLAWLRTLVWPEHEARRARLAAAAALTAQHGVRVVAADLRNGPAMALDTLAAEAPRDATLVVTHSATFAYLDEPTRRATARHVAALGAHRIGYEARGIDPAVPDLDIQVTPNTSFVAALDGKPYALGDGHGTVLTRP
ncbi:DUF2332 family protein [Streptomyces sp. NPDC056144]|uniref:DUF2332 family protein n=1 Tax=unclassified Streptomyces TaxID=2593676 RepID=UPI0035E258BB